MAFQLVSRLCVLVGFVGSLSACRGEDGGVGALAQAVAPGYGLTVVRVDVDGRVRPDGKLNVRIVAKNSGTSTWEPDDTRLVYGGDAGWKKDASLRLETQPGKGSRFSFVVAMPLSRKNTGESSPA